MGKEYNDVLIKKEIKKYEMKFAKLQMQLKEKNKGLIIFIDGWGTSGKGNLINGLIDELETKFYKVYNMEPIFKQNDDNKPMIAKYFERIPEIGKISIFNHSWLSEFIYECQPHFYNNNPSFDNNIEDICNFERQLFDNGYIVIKLFLDISKKELGKRIEKISKEKYEDWRISANDMMQYDEYDSFKSFYEETIRKTSKEHSPWFVLNAKDKKETKLEALKQICNHINYVFDNKILSNIDYLVQTNEKDYKNTNILSKVDLSKNISDEEYKEKLKKLQKHLGKLHAQLYKNKIPLIIAYEGWDAAGKGGNIKRVTKKLDARGFEVIPIANPTLEEKNKHYLWRFWNKIPQKGHIAIFDRTWYGRVMVERIEGFCKESDWKRAYTEINEFEQTLTNNDAIIIKFWVQIDKDTQLERFNDRQNNEDKQWKITDEDWRNREKWDIYEQAINEMIAKTNKNNAHWFILESNNKKYARIRALEIIIEQIEIKLMDIRYH